ncbi:hypothetical protein Dimus_012430 [Dionaea muscipula]
MMNYWKMNEPDHRQPPPDFQLNSRKRILIIALSSIVLVVVVVAAVVATRGSDNGSSSQDQSSGDGSMSTSLKAACDATLYPDTCVTSLSPLVKSNQVLSPEDLFKLFIQVANIELSKAENLFVGLNGTSVQASAALDDCHELLGLALDHLNDTYSQADALFSSYDDFRTWLSSVGTCQQTCIDGLSSVDANLGASASQSLKNSTELTSNALAIITYFSNLLGGGQVKLRRLMDFQGWVSLEDRSLLERKVSQIKPNIIVASDGSGNFRTIGQAIQAVPQKSKTRVVIYVKKGVYNENVKIGQNIWNLMMFGDGMNQTTVSGSLNFVDGTTTFQSATFAVMGKNFIARDMGFRNTAGAIKQQAVALLAGGDQTIFYRCRMDAFQDTLYTYTNRQLYRECEIYGTVDFIFGNSAAVFQNCNIFPRLPILGQEDTITAQGKFDPNQNTGIAIQNCSILPLGNLANVQVYLGRPWKNYSTTVFMESYMGALIDPQGWLPWVGNSAPPTIFYGEYSNRGPGASTKRRVKWVGVRNLAQNQASKFTVDPFIQGNQWISAGVHYNPGL